MKLIIFKQKYKLETFTEKRETAWVFQPYKGEPIYHNSFGTSPSPWEIFVAPSASFQKSKRVLEIPNTAYVKPCHACAGNGRVRCRSCNGFGGVINKDFNYMFV